MQRQAIGRNIIIVDKYFKLFMRDALKAHDLNVSEAMVLLCLYKKNGQTSKEILRGMHKSVPGSTQDQLIDELHYDKGVMTRTMQSLEKKGYVLRADNPDDSRSYVFNLTEQAAGFKPVLIGVLREMDAVMLQGFEEAELAAFNASLEKIIANATAEGCSKPE